MADLELRKKKVKEKLLGERNYSTYSAIDDEPAIIFGLVLSDL